MGGFVVLGVIVGRDLTGALPRLLDAGQVAR